MKRYFSPGDCLAKAKQYVKQHARILGTGGTFLSVIAGLAAPMITSQVFTASAASVNTNCTLIVPEHPLSAKGLATPYLLTATNPKDGPCHEANTAQTAFVQGAVFDPASGRIAIYNPLVTDKGKEPAIEPKAPNIPDNAIVALWFGFNGDNLTLAGEDRNTLAEGRCVNGVDDSVFGQFAYCNAPQFFWAANQAVQSGRLRIPPLGFGKDGLPCPTVRSFRVVDQDPSDNVTTAYLATRSGRTAQFTKFNARVLPVVTVLTNPSDNGLLVAGIDPALGCTPWMAPDLADPGSFVTALPLNELQAAFMQGQPVATVPAQDPMVLVGDDRNLTKQNLYRIGVDQQPIPNPNFAEVQNRAFCINLVNIQPKSLFLDKPFFIDRPSPDPAVANSLFTFLAQRFNGSIVLLKCDKLYGIKSPIKLIMHDGITIGAVWKD